MYFQFQMFSIFWVWLTTLFENSVITNLVHLMLLLKLPNLHILFYITSPACVMIHRLLQLCNYYLFLFFDGSGSLQSCFPDIFLCLNVVLTLHQLCTNFLWTGLFGASQRTILAFFQRKECPFTGTKNKQQYIQYLFCGRLMVFCVRTI